MDGAESAKCAANDCVGD